MSEKLEKLLEKLIAEQRRTSLYTLTLERDRLLAALIQAGLATGGIFFNEFSLAAGASANVLQLVPAGFVYLQVGPGFWNTSLPWWCSYSMWIDQTAPATPVATANRMPSDLQTTEFKGIFPIRGFLLHSVTNNHATEHAYAGIQNAMAVVTVETWEMIRAVYLDAIVADVRRKALEISGIPR